MQGVYGPMKKLLSLQLLLCAVILIPLQANRIEPLYKLHASGMVYDMVIDSGRLYAATDAGRVDIFDIASRKIVNRIELPGIKDFMGDLIASKIYSVDVLKDSILMVSAGKSGYRNVYLYDGKVLKKVIDSQIELTIKEARFIDKDRILLGLLGNELILYQISSGKQLYKVQMSPSHFNDLALNEDRSKVATADESGVVYILNVADGKTVQILSGQNVDNIYKIDFKKGVVITAGQDRRCAVYRSDRKAYYLPGTFLIYAAGLSPSGKTGLFAANMENEVQVFNTKTKSKIAMLGGHNATLTCFAFLNETELFSAAEENDILFWKLD
jgi:WD40 repeat protein